jgi:hypothetical protein
MEQMLGPINNWRASHSYPLFCFRATLRNRAKGVDPGAVIAQRLKRLVSIEAKLRRFPDMKLSQIQDIGGCRAVLKDNNAVRDLTNLYAKSQSKNPSRRHGFLHVKDYVAEPKTDGYRSVHLIYRYQSPSKKHRVYNGLKIEIQIRSKLQHAWATAVETVDTFTGQALKASQGEKDWHRFFALMGTHIAREEGGPDVPETPASPRELADELRDLVAKLNVRQILEAWRIALKEYLPKANATYLLLFLDSAARTLHVTPFQQDQFMGAQEAYAEAEKRVDVEGRSQAVLVAVENLRQLRRAFPNYFLDTGQFMTEVRRAIAKRGRATRNGT